jgi:hypothetical protein
MTDEHITLTTPVLGTRPFILIEAHPDDDSPLGFELKVNAGGGVGSQDEMLTLLLVLVEEMSGVDCDLYLQQTQTARAAAGLEPLALGS